MTSRSLVLLCCLARLAPAQQPSCHPVGDSQIHAKDMAGVFHAFDKIPPETVLGASPLPGSSRTFHQSELTSIAEQYAVPTEGLADVCFAWQMQPLSAGRVLDAMRASLQVPDVSIEIVELPVKPVPVGALAFPLDQLHPPAAGDQIVAVLWRGEVILAGNQRYPIWARVRVSTPCDRLVATEPLRPGVVILPAQLRKTSGICFPRSKQSSFTMEQASGLLPLRFVPAGGEVRPELLVAAYEIYRGDSVEVEVRVGATRLVFTGKAESDGRAGDMIALRNPDSNRTFRARVSGKDKATVTAVTEGRLP